MRRGAGSRSGFTLLEVLAAVAILGLSFTVIFGTAMSAMQAEGEAGRRLRAALLADRALNDLESGLALGAAPPVGVNETEEEEFVLVTEVRPFDLAAYAATLQAEGEQGRPRGSRDPDPRAAAVPALLAAPARGTPPLLEMEVVVRWLEGAREQEVRRLTYGFDVTAALGVLESLAPPGEAGTGGADDGNPEGQGLGPGGLRQEAS